jgi:hypothetical protein
MSRQRGGSVTLWIAAFLVAVALGYFQRTTGPTYPLTGTLSLGGSEVSYKLARAHGGEGGLDVVLPAPEGTIRGVLEWRRFPTNDEWKRVKLSGAEGGLRATIPHQPPAGKVEYRVVLRDGDEQVRVPDHGSVVARFRGDVPASILIPHILAMFGSMLLATRALFEVLRRSRPMARGFVLGAMVLLVVGGLFLGPLVQKFAFDAYWTGWPFGTDLTDNKTLIAVLAWLPATIIALRSGPTRVAVIMGWVVMMGVFLIPHSLHGSEIDWSEQSPSTAEQGSGDLASETASS